ncbi:hypothetical protein [Rhodopirellula sp. P2]|uniref:hypothetical protein n=1 Tax=Rhodopirellula sp. P2 TaxID=2127060 RepID=UPI002367F1C5|nr:hypothetical protein [Rhodopirellula sp. P2]WDQ17275.1 hypothetical protein PSR62_01665 [Rhodopirellula sp. P2]
MSTETSVAHEADWTRVRSAICSRWPQINHEELSKCPDEVARMVEYVQGRVDASQEEVESVVREFAPQESIVERISHSAEDQLQRASENAQFAVMRADECIAERPTQSVLASFVAGALVGVTVTALWMRQRREPTRWEHLKTRTWG